MNQCHFGVKLNVEQGFTWQILHLSLSWACSPTGLQKTLVPCCGSVQPCGVGGPEFAPDEVFYHQVLAYTSHQLWVAGLDTLLVLVMGEGFSSEMLGAALLHARTVGWL